MVCSVYSEAAQSTTLRALRIPHIKKQTKIVSVASLEIFPWKLPWKSDNSDDEAFNYLRYIIIIIDEK